VLRCAAMPPPMAADLVREVVRVFDASGVDLTALGLAWARVTPTVVLVPAFGLRALPPAARGVLGLMLAVSIAPALGVVASPSLALPWPVLALGEVVRGVPIAIAAAVPLWAATMAGGVVDALRGSQESVTVPTVEGRATPLGVPLSLLACAIFLSTGGPARVVRALAAAGTAAPGLGPVVACARDLASGVGLAVAIGAPLLVAAIVLEIGAALVARAATPAQVHALMAPVRALGILAVMAVVLDRMAWVMAAAMR
jgi:type III secretory pathway component EscT